ncbi:MAG: hypothetical protein VX431_02450 [Planctomycetota bacterium]|nr:hypothetical protein [Planctomycetota bacterium]
MQDILFHYKKIHPMNWVYLSSLLTICVYFKFSRFWSVRNLDLVGLLLFAPGLVLVAYGNANPGAQESVIGIGQLGYIWLFSVGGLFLVRMLMDSIMVRRPLLEPNLSVGGMTFLGIALLIFLMANIANSDPKELTPLPTEISTIIDATEEGTAATKGSAEVDSEEKSSQSGLQQYGPRNPLLALLPEISTQTFFPNTDNQSGDASQVIYDPRRIAVAKSIAILSHLAVIIGMVLIGHRHFDNIKTGIAAAVLYLLLPYTAEMTGRVPHVLPAALLVWAVVTYRRPMIAGIFLGLAIGVIYYPLFLLPLWISFYWKRGVLRFCGGLALALAVSVGLLAIYQSNDALWADVQQMLGIAPPKLTNLQGFWQHIDAAYRLPVIATFVALGGSFAIWPPQKNLGTLMSCSAAMMLGCQFWNAHGGGLYMAWYLPLLLLTIFRPNLEDRVATSVLTPNRGVS